MLNDVKSMKVELKKAEAELKRSKTKDYYKILGKLCLINCFFSQDAEDVADAGLAHLQACHEIVTNWRSRKDTGENRSSIILTRVVTKKNSNLSSKLMPSSPILPGENAMTSVKTRMGSTTAVAWEAEWAECHHRIWPTCLPTSERADRLDLVVAAVVLAVVDMAAAVVVDHSIRIRTRVMGAGDRSDSNRAGTS